MLESLRGPSVIRRRGVVTQFRGRPPPYILCQLRVAERIEFDALSFYRFYLHDYAPVRARELLLDRSSSKKSNDRATARTFPGTTRRFSRSASVGDRSFLDIRLIAQRISSMRSRRAARLHARCASITTGFRSPCFFSPVGLLRPLPVASLASAGRSVVPLRNDSVFFRTTTISVSSSLI